MQLFNFYTLVACFQQPCLSLPPGVLVEFCPLSFHFSFFTTSLQFFTTTTTFLLFHYPHHIYTIPRFSILASLWNNQPNYVIYNTEPNFRKQHPNFLNYISNNIILTFINNNPKLTTYIYSIINSITHFITILIIPAQTYHSAYVKIR